MYEPNVVGDWQECDEHPGLRLRVHGVDLGDPPHGRDDAAEGLRYFRLRVTVENRAARRACVHLEDGQVDVRVGADGESAFVDWRNSRFIEGFEVHPLRRATAVLYAAGPDEGLRRLDVQVQLRVDDVWTGRWLWVGGVGLDLPLPGTAGGPARDSGLVDQVSAFLRDRADGGR
ncbi:MULTISPECIES: hypothetical protein [unclassified Streptomyces]|uniref:hypothetical protein n=1 Tax=unclassified Streptomyces TaxID=2593676 RepID=UPI001904BCEC|nr:hypothetical protein [Streptomyces sp. HSG2]